MVLAPNLKTGMILQIEKNLYKVLATEYHMGGGKMGGLVHMKLREVRSGLLLDRKFKPDERLDMECRFNSPVHKGRRQGEGKCDVEEIY
jgi:translation elongation factor P/translation initiation factor 5A